MEYPGMFLNGYQQLISTSRTAKLIELFFIQYSSPTQTLNPFRFNITPINALITPLDSSRDKTGILDLVGKGVFYFIL